MRTNPDWQAEVLRLSLFTITNQSLNAEKWWPLVTSEEPEQVISQPKKGIYRAIGAFGKGGLTLNIEPSRIDWLYTPAQNPPDDAEMPPYTIGGAINERDFLFNAVKPWLSQCPDIIRIAYGATLFENVKDIISGHRRLADFLPKVEIDAENSTDFSYSINRPRESRIIPGLKINRLTKWNIMHFGVLELNTGVSVDIPENIACRLELDINTFQKHTIPIPTESLVQLFQELINMGDEIALQGDIQ
jgi:hypothetical protein